MKRTIARLITVFTLLLLIGIVLPISTQAQLDVSSCAEVTPTGAINSDCMSVMTAFPSPVTIPVPQDITTLSLYSFWHVLTDNANVFDAPGGGVVRQIAPGFNFVRVISTSDGWVQIETGEWMQAVDVEYYEPSYFRGARILNGLETSFAWVLGDIYSVEYPGASQDPNKGQLYFRYDLVNIFGAVEADDGWTWYMIGPNQWIEQRMVAKVFKIDRPEDVEGRWVAVDLYEQTLVAYEDDTPIFATLISSGLPGTETNEGVHEVWTRLENDAMSGSTGAPNAYALQSVPWVMYFDDSISLHGTYWHDVFGYRASRGCVNLSISDANYLYKWFRDAIPDEDDEIINAVYVHSSGDYRAPGR
jgi:hypothetical protein